MRGKGEDDMRIPLKPNLEDFPELCFPCNCQLSVRTLYRVQLFRHGWVSSAVSLICRKLVLKLVALFVVATSSWRDPNRSEQLSRFSPRLYLGFHSGIYRFVVTLRFQRTYYSISIFGWWYLLQIPRILTAFLFRSLATFEFTPKEFLMGVYAGFY